MISKETIDQIFQTARVEEVIGDFVQLKKSGSNYKGLSPFTQEKSPSFMVSPAKQIWKDFSSGKGGSVVSFIMEHEQFTYPEALRWLAKRYNIEIEEDFERTDEQIAEAKVRENQYTITEFANKWFQQQLLDSEEGRTIGYAYFKERGLNKKSIETFNLGYSPKQWDAFTAHALEKGYSYEALNEVGLTVGSKDKPVDRFRERVMFPIQSFSGRTLGFGARILGNNKKTAKYLNSPENQIYHKSKILYGIFQAKQAILKEDECYLVEGYTDVISMHQSGVENVVASSGTALTAEQIRLVKRLTDNLTLVFDSDPAGIRASFRGIDLILEQELNVRVVVLPKGEDPDSFARKHKDSELKDYFKENSTDFIRFKVGVLKEDAGTDPVKNSEMIQSVINSIALIPNLIQRELYIREASSILNMREELLFNQLAIKLSEQEKDSKRKKLLPKESPLQVSTPEKESAVNPFVVLEDELLKLMIRYGNEEIMIPYPEDQTKFYKSTVSEEIIWQLENDEVHFTIPHYQDMFLEIKRGLENKEYRMGEFFVRHENKELSQLASGFIFEKYKLSSWEKQGIIVPTGKDNLGKRTLEVIYNYKRLLLDSIIKNTSKQLKEDITEKERQKLIKKVMRLTALKQYLDGLLNRSV
ncbi:DNA primase [Flavobacteriaceae bacterium Ap0902]|nr:DNA primase [Flavobacteriaceae bacterium Ap0902]